MKYWSQKGEDDYKMLRIYNSETNALVEMKDISEAMRFWFETYPQWESDRTSTAPKTTTTTTTTTTKTATTTTATTSTTTTTTATTTVESKKTITSTTTTQKMTTTPDSKDDFILEKLKHCEKEGFFKQD